MFTAHLRSCSLISIVLSLKSKWSLCCAFATILSTLCTGMHFIVTVYIQIKWTFNSQRTGFFCRSLFSLLLPTLCWSFSFLLGTNRILSLLHVYDWIFVFVVKYINLCWFVAKQWNPPICRPFDSYHNALFGKTSNTNSSCWSSKYHRLVLSSSVRALHRLIIAHTHTSVPVYHYHCDPKLNTRCNSTFCYYYIKCTSRISNTTCTSDFYCGVFSISVSASFPSRKERLAMGRYN